MSRKIGEGVKLTKSLKANPIYPYSPTKLEDRVERMGTYIVK